MIGKKGQDREAMWWLIDLLALVFILLVVFNFIGGLGEQRSYQKQFLAEDLGLLLDVLPALPGVAELEYPEPLLGFSVEFLKDEVRVGDPDPHTARFLPDSRAPVSPSSFLSEERAQETFVSRYAPVFTLLQKQNEKQRQQAAKLFLLKDGTGITISEKKKNTAIFPCPSASTWKGNVAYVVDDASRGLLISFPVDERIEIVEREQLQGLKPDTLLLVLLPSEEKAVWYDLDSGAAPALAAASCRIANSLDAPSLPLNARTLSRKTDIPSGKPVLAISLPASLPLEKLDAVGKAAYQELGGMIR